MMATEILRCTSAASIVVMNVVRGQPAVARWNLVNPFINPHETNDLKTPRASPPKGSARCSRLFPGSSSCLEDSYTTRTQRVDLLDHLCKET